MVSLLLPLLLLMLMLMPRIILPMVTLFMVPPPPPPLLLPPLHPLIHNMFKPPIFPLALPITLLKPATIPMLLLIHTHSHMHNLIMDIGHLISLFLLVVLHHLL